MGKNTLFKYLNTPLTENGYLSRILILSGLIYFTATIFNTLPAPLLIIALVLEIVIVKIMGTATIDYYILLK